RRPSFRRSRSGRVSGASSVRYDLRDAGSQPVAVCKWLVRRRFPAANEAAPMTQLLDEATVRSTLDTALSRGGDFAEVFVEDRRSSSAFLDDGKVEELTSGHDRGAGIRVVVGETTGFAHTADLSDTGLRAAAEAAAAAARGGGGRTRTVALSERSAPRPN